MIPSIIVPTATQMAVQPVMPLNQAVVAPVPAQAANSLVYQAVPANTAPVALFNNVKGGGNTQPLEKRSAEVMAQAFKEHASTKTHKQASAQHYGANSAFVAQAISQEDAMNDNQLYREEAAWQAPSEPPSALDYVENHALHLSSLQRVSIKAYHNTVSRNTTNLNQQALLQISRSA